MADRGWVIRNGDYVPGPTEIREKCAAIQSTWTDAERDSRYAAAHGLTLADMNASSVMVHTMHDFSERNPRSC